MTFRFFITSTNLRYKCNEEPRLSGINPPFGGLSLSSGGVPTCYAAVRRGSKPTRLACVRRTASVHSELGSNSSKMDTTIVLPSIALRVNSGLSPLRDEPADQRSASC